MSEHSPTQATLELGAALKALRERRGLKAIELGRRANVPRSQISQIEHGRANPTFDTLVRLLDVLNGELRIFTRSRP